MKPERPSGTACEAGLVDGVLVSASGTGADLVWAGVFPDAEGRNDAGYDEGRIGGIGCLVFFTAPTATFRVLFVFIVLAHDRRRIVHFNVTDNPTAEWTSRQMVEAFCDGESPRFLIRDRDGIYGLTFRDRVAAMEIEEVVVAPQSPWQSPCVERVIGSLRRECLDHVIVLG